MFENWKIVAYRDVDFTDDSGKRIQGVLLFLARPSRDRGWRGVEVSKFFINSNSEILNKELPKIGSDVQIGFNRFGKISFLEAV